MTIFRSSRRTVLPGTPRRFPRATGSLLTSPGVLALVLVTVIAFLGPLFTPYSPLEKAGDAFTPPNWHFLFGTDGVGRDVFSRVITGLSSSWFSAVVVIAVGVLIGSLVGATAGLAGGWIDDVLMRFTDGFLALPGAVVAIAVVASLGASLQHTLLAVTAVWWPYYARIIRGDVRAIASLPHVEAARLSGNRGLRLAFRHVLPGVVPSLVVAATLDVGYLVLTLASLAFLGLGAPAPAPELGAMSAQGLSSLLDAWWISVAPGLAICLLALIANLAGDNIRRRMGEI